MMCLKTFENKTFDNCDNWVNFVNENYNYALTKSKVKDFRGKCKEIDLPSYHPYWKLISKLRLRKYLFRTTDYYNECLKDREKIKYYFNKSTTILDIENKIKGLKQRIYYD